MGLMNLLSEKISRIKLIHDDIRIYLRFLNEIGTANIHWGLWNNKPSKIISKDEFVLAQADLSKFVIVNIPKSVKSILDVGGGVGGFSHDLVKHGFNLLCIVPDKKLINFGKKRFPEVKFLRGSAEFFSTNMKYDTAIMLESFQYFSDKGRALSNISKYLNNNSSIMIIDEFDFSDDLSLGLPIESKLIKSLGKFGFLIKKNIELSEKVMPTCDFVSTYFKYKNSKIYGNWASRKTEYLSGKIKYKLLVFEKN